MGSLSQSRQVPQPERRPFWRFEWERWLIESGKMADLKPVERAVLWVMAIGADKNSREQYWSVPRLASATGYVDKNKTYRAVRDARRSLEEKGLIELVSEGGGRLASTYRIVNQLDTQGQSACRDNSEPVARSKTCSESGPYRLPGVPFVGTPVQGTPAHSCRAPLHTVAGVTAHITEHKTAAACADGPDGDAPDVLWESPTATAAAAADLLVDFGINRRQAVGIIGEYKPTADQVRIVLDNLRAWIAAAERGERQPPRMPVRFIKSQLRDRVFTVDPAVSAEQDRKAKQMQDQQREEEQEIVRQQEQTKAQARQQAEQRFNALPADEQRRLMDAQRPTTGDGAITVKPSDVQLRGWAIDELTKQATS